MIFMNPRKSLFLLLILVFSIGTATTILAEENYVIPAWIKTTASFWANDEISDQEFGEGISYLIENDIIKVPKSLHLIVNVIAIIGIGVGVIWIIQSRREKN